MTVRYYISYVDITYLLLCNHKLNPAPIYLLHPCKKCCNSLGPSISMAAEFSYETCSE